MSKVTIEVEGKFTDHISEGALKAATALKQLELAARKIKSISSKAGYSGGPFVRSLRQNENLIRKLGQGAETPSNPLLQRTKSTVEIPAEVREGKNSNAAVIREWQEMFKKSLGQTRDKQPFYQRKSETEMERGTGTSKGFEALTSVLKGFTNARKASQNINTSRSFGGSGVAPRIARENRQVYSQSHTAKAYAVQNSERYAWSNTGYQSVGNGNHDANYLSQKTDFSSIKQKAQRIEISPDVELKPQIKSSDFQSRLQQEIGGRQTLRTQAEVQTDWECDKFDSSLLKPEGRYNFATDAQVKTGWKYNPFDGSLLAPEKSYAFSTGAQLDLDWKYNPFNGSLLTPGESYAFAAGAQLDLDWKYNPFNGSLLTPGESYAFAAGAQLDLDWKYNPFDGSLLTPEKSYIFAAGAQLDLDWKYNPFDGSLLTPEKSYTFAAGAQLDLDWKYSPFDPGKLAPEDGYSFAADAHIDANWEYSPFDISRLAPEGGYSFTTNALVNINWEFNPFDETQLVPSGGHTFATNAYLNVNWNCTQFDSALIKPPGGYAFTTDAHVSVEWDCERFDPSLIAPESHYSFSTEVSVHPHYSVTGRFSPSKSTFGIADSVSFTQTVYVTPNIVTSKASVSTKGSLKRARGGIIGPKGPVGFAEGGMVRGGAQLVTVAEEGTPEMIIPLGPQRRRRGVELWRKAGHMLGVEGFADGGIAGTKGRMVEPFKLNNYSEEFMSAPYTHSDEIFTHREPGPTLTGGVTNVTVNTGGITLQIDMQGADNDIIAGVEKHRDEIAEVIAGVVGRAIGEVFINSPKRGGETA